MRKAIPYYRVSTERQGASGLGLEAQQNVVREYARQFNLELISEFTEVESGSTSKRPVLLQALEHCRRNCAILLIAKLDRLGRNVAFISKLMESEVDFIAVDNPHASKLVVHIMAAFAEFERDQISRRTKEALQVAKSRGKKLGVFGASTLSKRNKEKSRAFAIGMTPVILELQEEGYTTIRTLTDELNARGVATYYGHNNKWHLNTVHQLLKHINGIH